MEGAGVHGQGEYRYRPVPGWGQLPDRWDLVEVAGVAVDAEDRVYVFNRGAHPVVVFDADGHFLRSWGEGKFVRPHGVTVSPDGTLYCVDDLDHTIRQYTPEGDLLRVLGTSGRCCDTGVRDRDFRTILRSGPPFNQPTNLAIAPNGDLYVTDGYGNARVHRFAPDGCLRHSWGDPGSAPGQFNLPHGIAVLADGRVLVADRENDRIQLFDPEGKYLDQWTQVQRPTNIALDREGRIYVSELWWRAGDRPPAGDAIAEDRPGRVSVLDQGGAVLARWGGPDPCAPGNFAAPHDICVDSRGDVYVAEVTWTFAGKAGLVPPDCHTLQKFTRGA